ncbi:hypothetical protein SpAn4DRAFT_2560 [Sporomusa ovata]|uniref:Uncharacterized protein n=1 Tax=Sporomusa ovata TaxID=2378 RepID=A0A0U1L0W7_9FIRM|nr:hypothetical protein SpAn4DRAFT_2560 [Sporomusa ovata]
MKRYRSERVKLSAVRRLKAATVDSGRRPKHGQKRREGRGSVTNK